MPTVAELGNPGYEIDVWFGLFAPAGTPKPVADLVNSKTNAVLASPSIKESFEKLGIEPVGGSPQVLTDRVDAEMHKWADIVRAKNIHLDQ